QGRSGQQGGPGAGDNPAVVKAFASGITTNAAVDPTASLLVGHAPSAPASHATTSSSLTPTASNSNEPPTTLSAWQNYDGGAGKIVRSASLSESASGAEMNVELRSG